MKNLKSANLAKRKICFSVVILAVVGGALYKFAQDETPAPAAALLGNQAICDSEHPSPPLTRAQYDAANAINDEGVKYWNGAGVPVDQAKAMDLFKQAAQMGLRIAQSNLGSIYWNNAVGDRDAATQWYCRAALAGDANGENGVGDLLTMTPTPDNEQAMRWYEKAAEQGQTAAQLSLALLKLNNGTTPADHVDGLKWLMIRKNEGVSDPQGQLEFRKKDATPQQIQEAEAQAERWTPEEDRYHLANEVTEPPSSTDSNDITSRPYPSSSYTSEQIERDNEKVEAITQDIQRNGPPELRQLDPTTIQQAARAFVSGERSGLISSSQMARMGGAEQATQNSLAGQLHALSGN